jgi:hypothetical protein
MPIPEPGRFRPSNLTAEQQKEQLAAIYGVPMNISESEIARMREILAQHDGQHLPMTTMDLNNPARKPYRFEKFPMAVYDHTNSYTGYEEERMTPAGRFETVHVAAKIVSRIVRSEQELAGALADGWSEQAPEFREEREEPLSARYANEAGRIDEALEKRKPGRPA